jgi:Ketopantoate reductase PanE/ApbA
MEGSTSQHGLRIEGTPGDDIVRFDTSDDAMQIGVADIVVFAVKLYQIEDAARAAAPLFGPETLAISLLKRLGVPTPHHAALYACSSRTPAGWQHSHDALGIIFTGLAPQLTTGSSPTQYKTLFRALAFCHR